MDQGGKHPKCNSLFLRLLDELVYHDLRVSKVEEVLTCVLQLVDLFPHMIPSMACMEPGQFMAVGLGMTCAGARLLWSNN